jgi:ubiquitin C-terminal hydrolase
MKNIKTLGQATAFLEELHGAEGEYRNLNRENIIDMREDIHRARASLSEDEYSDEEHQLALHANDILLKATFDSRENLLKILAEQAKWRRSSLRAQLGSL